MASMARSRHTRAWCFEVILHATAWDDRLIRREQACCVALTPPEQRSGYAGFAEEARPHGSCTEVRITLLTLTFQRFFAVHELMTDGL